MITKENIVAIADQFVNKISTRKQLELLKTSLEEVKDSLEDQQLDRIAMSISYTEEQKIKLLADKIVRLVGSDFFLITQLFEHILQNKQLEIFNPDNFNFLSEQIIKKAAGLKKIKISLAVELEEIDYLELKTKLRRRFEEDIILDTVIKPNIIAGFILQYDSTIIDASIEKSLEEYRHEWVASLNHNTN
jgi:F0F1-type ATP synthase delta subunit